MTQPRQHRKYSPSQAQRVLSCYGSTNLLARTPARPDTKYAKEGTTAHEILDVALQNGVRDAKEAHLEHSAFFDVDLNGIYEDFYASINAALNHVYAILDEHPDAIMYTEKFVDPPLPADPGEAGGYVDIMIFVPSTRTLFVIDYKHGAGVTVAIENNSQALQYAGGALYEENALVDPASVDTVVLCIIQPRAVSTDGPVREFIVTPQEVWVYLEKLNAAVIENQKVNAVLTEGEIQCRFCDANTSCPEREAKALRVAGATFSQINQVKSDHLPDPKDIDMQRLGHIRANAPLLKKWLGDIEKHCEELARLGYKVPGAKLVEVSAKRKYYYGEEETVKRIAALADMPESELYERHIMPITRAEKLVKEAYRARVGRGKKTKASEMAGKAFALLTLKQSSGNLVLVNEDDKRPAVNKAQDTFKQVVGILPPPVTKV